MKLSLSQAQSILKKSGFKIKPGRLYVRKPIAKPKPKPKFL
jgi:hypothetical protein